MSKLNIVYEDEHSEKGELYIRENPVGGSDTIPYVKLGRKNDKETIVISAGLHGNEVSGIQVIQNLWRNINPKKLNKNIILLPCLNPSGFRTNSRYPSINSTTENTKDPNRSYKVKPEQKPKNQIEHFYMTVQEFISQKANYYIDLHSSFFHSIPHIIKDPLIFKDGDKKSKKEAQELDKWINECCKQMKIRETVKPKFIEKEYINEQEVRTYNGYSTFKHNNFDKIPSITVELGPETIKNKEDINFLTSGLQNVLIHNNFIQGQENKLENKDFETFQNKKIARDIVLSGEKCGVIHKTKNAGEKFSKNETICEVMSCLGEIDKIKAQKQGVVLSYTPSQVVEQNDRVCFAGITSQEERWSPETIPASPKIFE